jgi:diadenosine tetraphosphate (Ap4A) HIT family hydrolase
MSQTSTGRAKLVPFEQDTVKIEDLFDLYRTSLFDHIDQSFGWNEDFQRRRFRASYDPSKISLIKAGIENAGSRSRNDWEETSDIDVIAFRDTDSTERVAKRWNGVFLDLFIHPTDEKADPSWVRIQGGRVLFQRDRFGDRVLCTAKTLFEAGPEPVSTDELLVRKVTTMDKFEICRLGMYRLSQAGAYRLPGYLIVDTAMDVVRFAEIPPEERANLITIFQIAEELLIRLLGAERVYTLRFGESVNALHFHVVPRTREVALACGQTSEPLNGAKVVEWIWENHVRLGYTDADICNFSMQARQSAQLCVSPGSSALPAMPFAAP